MYVTSHWGHWIAALSRISCSDFHSSKFEHLHLGYSKLPCFSLVCTGMMGAWLAFHYQTETLLFCTAPFSFWNFLELPLLWHYSNETALFRESLYQVKWGEKIITCDNAIELKNLTQLHNNISRHAHVWTVPVIFSYIRKLIEKIFVFEINCQSKLPTKLFWLIRHVLDEFATCTTCIALAKIVRSL